MPTYDVQDPDSGLSVTLEGDSPPTEQELTDIFKGLKEKQGPKMPYSLAPTIPAPGESLPTIQPMGEQAPTQAFPAIQQRNAEGLARNTPLFQAYTEKELLESGVRQEPPAKEKQLEPWGEPGTFTRGATSVVTSILNTPELLAAALNPATAAAVGLYYTPQVAYQFGADVNQYRKTGDKEALGRAVAIAAPFVAGGAIKGGIDLTRAAQGAMEENRPARAPEQATAPEPTILPMTRRELQAPAGTVTVPRTQEVPNPNPLRPIPHFQEAPVKYAGFQELPALPEGVEFPGAQRLPDGRLGFHQWTLTEDSPLGVKGSTLAEPTIMAKGYSVPEPPKPEGEPNAIPERGPEALPVEEPSGDSATVGQGVPGEQPGAAIPQEPGEQSPSEAEQKTLVGHVEPAKKNPLADANIEPTGYQGEIPIFTGDAARKELARRYGIPNQITDEGHNPFSGPRTRRLFIDDETGEPVAFHDNTPKELPPPSAPTEQEKPAPGPYDLPEHPTDEDLRKITAARMGIRPEDVMDDAWSSREKAITQADWPLIRNLYKRGIKFGDVIIADGERVTLGNIDFLKYRAEVRPVPKSQWDTPPFRHVPLNEIKALGEVTARVAREAGYDRGDWYRAVEQAFRDERLTRQEYEERSNEPWPKYTVGEEVWVNSQYRGPAKITRLYKDHYEVTHPDGSTSLQGEDVLEPLEEYRKRHPERAAPPYTANFLDRMKAAQTATQGRDIIHEHAAAIEALERSIGLKPTVGQIEPKFYRGFSTVKPAEWKKQIKEAKKIDPTKGAQLEDLVKQGTEFKPSWESLLKKEQAGQEAPPTPPTEPAGAPPTPPQEPKPPKPDAVTDIALRRQEIEGFKKEIARLEKLRDAKSKKMGSMVPPPIRLEVMQGFANRIQKVQDKIEAAEREIAALAPTAEPPAGAPPVVKTFDEANVETEANITAAKDKRVPNKQFKAQKEFLLDAIQQALDEAPNEVAEKKDLKLSTPELQADWEKFLQAQDGKLAPASVELLLAKYEIPEATESGAKYPLAQRVGMLEPVLLERSRQLGQQVVFDVPGDGVFTVHNNVESLRNFRDRVHAQFPKSAPKATEPGLASTRASKPPEVAKGKATPAEAADVLGNFVSEDESRGPIQFGYSNGQEMVATDGRRMIRIVGAFPGSVEKPKAIEHGRFSDWSEDRPFPQYAQVIPKPKDVGLMGTADTGELWNWVKQARLTTEQHGRTVGDKPSHPVSLWRNKDGSFGTSAEEAGFGESRHNVKEGAQFVGQYNADYLMDALAAARKLGDGKVDIYHGSDLLDPIVIRGANHETVLMGMRREGSGQGKAPKAIPADRAVHKAALPEPKEVFDPSRTMDAAEKRAKAKAKRKPKGEAWTTEAPETAYEDLHGMTDAELEAFLNKKFGDRPFNQPGEFGRPGEYTFPTYEKFRDWMNARFAEGDLEGMKLGFAEADTKTKVRYIKENTGDPILKGWIAHLATGSPLPPGKPVVPRTTPRPTARGTPAGGPRPGPGPGPRPPPGPGPGPRPGSGRPPPGSPPPGGSYQQPPPPRPRPSPNIPHHRKFDTTALVQLLRQWDKTPTINARMIRALGRYLPGTKAIELKHRLFWDAALAERVLGHEIGHFIDLAVSAIGHGHFANRLKPLEDFTARIAEVRELRDEARALSAQWRGSFRHGDPYRDNPKELFADFMSAMFNAPEWVNQNYGKLFDAFQELRNSKPKFAAAYREIETWLQGGTTADEIRKQHLDEVKRTFEILSEPRTKTKATLGERIKFATLTMWDRAYQKEGKPRELGSSIAETLEYSRMWSAKENALFADDVKKTVDSHLRQVDPDPIQARTMLHTYSQAARTIGERRAAGVWIEANPLEARAALDMIAHLDSGIYAKWAGDIASVPDHQLYDLFSAIAREVHDRGEVAVKRFASAIDEMNLGVKGQSLLLAFNVRGKLLNPSGLTVDTARQLLKSLQDQLGPAKYRELEQAAANLRSLIFENQRKMVREGLIPRAVWEEVIAPNQGNYVPYAVLDYFEGHVRAGVLPQKGTAKDIADIMVATELKVAAQNAWRQSQRQVDLIRKAYEAGGLFLPVGRKLKRSADIEDIRRLHRDDDVSRAVLWVDGKPRLMEFPGDNGKLFEKALNNPAFYEHMQWIGEVLDKTHRLMQFYTQYSMPFMLWRNPVRGLRTGGLKVGFRNVAKHSVFDIPELQRLARNYAQAAFGGEMLPEIRELVDSQALSPPHLAQSYVRNADHLQELMENHGILAYQVRRFTEGNTPRWWQVGKMLPRAVQASEKLFAAYEAGEKIYNYHAALERGLTKEQAIAIARRGGIPNPGVGGKWSTAMEVFWPWTRVHMQGIRATFDMLRDPTLGRGFGMRFLVTEAMPRLAKIAIASGVVGGWYNWMLGHEQDPKDTVMGEYFRRMSPYQMALDDIVPGWFYDPRAGKIHSLGEFKKGSEIPKHYEAAGLRLPASEEGRLWGVLLYNVMAQMPNVKGDVGKPSGNPITAFGDWAMQYAVPGITPAIKIGSTLYDLTLRGKNPDDPYRGQPSANPKLYEAGGLDAAQAVLGYTLNQLSSLGDLAGFALESFGLLDPRARDAIGRRLPGDYKTLADRVPFFRTMITHGNYATYREEQITKLEQDELRAKSRLVMSDDVGALADFYYRNERRQAKLTQTERIQFEAARTFVNQLWGKLDNPDSFFSRAAHASGPDGSHFARETVRRNLDTAAAPLINVFRNARLKEAAPKP